MLEVVEEDPNLEDDVVWHKEGRLHNKDNSYIGACHFFVTI